MINRYIHSWAEDALDLITLEDARQVSVGHLGLRQDVVALLLWLGLPGAVDLVKLAECALSPDDESTDIATWSKAKQVELLDVDGFHAGDVSETTGQTAVISVDDDWSKTLHATTVAELSLTSTESLRLVDSLNILPCIDLLEELNSLLSLGELLDLVGNDQGKLRDFANWMSFREKKYWW